MIEVLGPDTRIGSLVRAAQSAGRRVSVVPAGPDKRSTLESFAEALDFPGWFGHNLDALADCLHHLAGQAEGEWHLVLDGAAALQQADERAYAGICGVLNEVAEEHPGFRATVVER